jgi:hypothetical protein
VEAVGKDLAVLNELVVSKDLAALSEAVVSEDPMALGEAIVVEADVEEWVCAAWTRRWSTRHQRWTRWQSGWWSVRCWRWSQQ